MREERRDSTPAEFSMSWPDENGAKNVWWSWIMLPGETNASYLCPLVRLGGSTGYVLSEEQAAQYHDRQDIADYRKRASACEGRVQIDHWLPGRPEWL